MMLTPFSPRRNMYLKFRHQQVDGLVAQGSIVRFHISCIVGKEAHNDQCCFYCEIKYSRTGGTCPKRQWRVCVCVCVCVCGGGGGGPHRDGVDNAGVVSRPEDPKEENKKVVCSIAWL